MKQVELLLLHPFNGPLSRITRVSQYQKGKTNLDFTETTYSEWQWHQLDHMQVCTSLQADNHASTPPLKFFYRLYALPAAQFVKALTASNSNVSAENKSFLINHST